jgi:hypothetical protein
MQELELFEWAGSHGGHGHVGGHGEQDARERLAKRGLGNINSIKPLEDEPVIPGWPPTERERIWFQQLMLEPSI